MVKTICGKYTHTNQFGAGVVSLYERIRLANTELAQRIDFGEGMC